jgi:hypothetical protein
MPYVTASTILKAEPQRHWVFQQLAFPFPISDRFYTIVIESDTGGAALGRYRVAWRLAGDAEPRQQGTGEPTRVNNGSWSLQPLGEKEVTQVTYVIHTDPGGALPAFAVNMANTVAVPLVIEKLRARAASAPPR